MQILLLCQNQSGQIAFPAEDIAGLPAPERRYSIVESKVVLTGYADTILHHDADELLKQAVFRMPTPAEQEVFAKEQEQTGAAQEEASPEHSGTDVPPAVDSKKKVAG